MQEDSQFPSRQSLGDGLWRVTRGDSAYYTFRYRDRVTGLQREKGIGPVRCLTQSQARAKVRQLKGILYSGAGDPIDQKRKDREEALRERALRTTFGEYAKSYIEHSADAWRNAKHASQWTNTLATYCKTLSPLALRDITTDHIVDVLKPIWKKKHVTATRVRQRIEMILDAAAAERLRDKDNPARWEENLEHRKELKVSRGVGVTRHHPSLPYDEISALVAELLGKDCMAAKAMVLQILTATRPSEAAAAQWKEFNLDEGYWVIPAERMKAFVAHRVPLAPQLVAMLESLPRHPSGNVFPGLKGKPICTDAMLKLAKRMRPRITCHGFRSTFRTWVSDKTNYHEEIAEMALAHTVKDKLIAAYRRTTMYEKRSALMNDWAAYCCPSLAPAA